MHHHHQNRWRYHDTKPVFAPVRPEIRIARGDLLFLDFSDYSALPFDRFLDGAVAIYEEEARRRVLAAQRFLGVSMDDGEPGEKALVRVATAGVFEFDLLPQRPMMLADIVRPAGNQAVEIRGAFDTADPAGTLLHAVLM